MRTSHNWSIQMAVAVQPLDVRQRRAAQYPRREGCPWQRWRLATVGCLILLLATAGCADDALPVSADATMSPPSPRSENLAHEPSLSQAERVRNEELIEIALEPIWEFINASDAEKLASVVSDSARRAAIVYWVGEIPADLRRLTGVTASGVRIEVRAARFGQADQEAAAELIFGKAEELGFPRPEFVRLNSTHSGLEVGFVAEALASLDRKQVRSAIEELTEMPTEILESAPFILL